MIALTAEMRAGYQRLWDTATVPSNRAASVDIWARSSIANRPRYEAVGAPMGVPWHFIAAVHMLESGQNFRRHLHNGDPLSARTVQVPAGRPVDGAPPFTWEQSAEDALRMRGVHQIKDWSVPGLLFQLEGYNGWGYRKFHPETLSPYLWSFTNHYVSGKYVADGAWDPAAVSAQCGGAALIQRLLDEKGGALGQAPVVPAPGQQEPLSESDRLNDAEMARLHGVA